MKFAPSGFFFLQLFFANAKNGIAHLSAGCLALLALFLLLKGYNFPDLTTQGRGFLEHRFDRFWFPEFRMELAV